MLLNIDKTYEYKRKMLRVFWNFRNYYGNTPDKCHIATIPYRGFAASMKECCPDNPRSEFRCLISTWME